MPRTVRWLFVLAIAAIGGFFLFSGDAAERPTEVAPVVDKRVEAARVDAAAARRSLRFSGVVRAVDRATLAFAIGGRMIARPVEVGDRVARGDVVARLDPRELDNAVAGAEGALAELEARREQARRDLERVEALVAAKAATSEERERTAAGLEAVAAGEDSARARLSEARRLRDEGVLRAPFAGTITETLLEPGEFAVPGRPIVAVAGGEALELEVELPESLIDHVSPGMTVRVEPASGTSVRAVDATVTRVGRAAPDVGRLFPAIAALPAGNLWRPGATADLVVALESTGALSVPVEAVANPGGRRPSVWRLQEAPAGDSGTGGSHLVERVFVEVGELAGERVMVRADRLTVGDQVVVGGQRGLLDGERVEIVGGAER